MASDNTVAIIAVSMTGLVGVLAPTISGLFQRHQKRSDLRQQRELDEVQQRREVLSAALDALGLFNSSMADMKAVPGVGAPTNPRVELKGDAFDQATLGIVLQSARIAMWFGSDDELVKSYEACMTAVIASHMARLMQEQRGEPEQTVEQIAKRSAKLNSDFVIARTRFLAAAKPHLRVVS